MSSEQYLKLKEETSLCQKKRLDKVVQSTLSNLQLKTKLKSGFNNLTANTKSSIKLQSA